MLLQNFQTSLLKMTYSKLTVSGCEFSFTDLPPYDPKKIHMDHYWGDVAALTDGYGEI